MSEKKLAFSLWDYLKNYQNFIKMGYYYLRHKVYEHYFNFFESKFLQQQMKIIHSYKEFYKKNGLIKTVLKIVSKPFRFINKKIAYRNFIKSRNKIFDHKSIKDRFSYIYSAHYWPSNESVSGPGSELKNTKNIREEIKKIIDQYKIKKFLDIPCGDFTWIQNVIN